LNRLALDGFSEVVQTIRKRKLSPDSILFFSTLKMGELEHYFENFGAAFHSYQQAVEGKPSSLSDSFLLKPYVFLRYYLLQPKQVRQCGAFLCEGRKNPITISAAFIGKRTPV
jgi:hypothetical protein